MNNTSEQKNYDSGLPEEEEGITYYIRYCPEDDSYLPGTDCEGQGCLAHDVHHLEMDKCQEAVEEWTELGPNDSPRPAHRRGRPLPQQTRVQAQTQGQAKVSKPPSRGQAPCQRPEELQDQDQDLGGEAQVDSGWPWGSGVRGREQRHLCSPQVRMRVSSPCVQSCTEVPATPVHPSDAIVNAEEILLRLTGSQSSWQTPSPSAELGSFPCLLWICWYGGGP